MTAVDDASTRIGRDLLEVGHQEAVGLTRQACWSIVSGPYDYAPDSVTAEVACGWAWDLRHDDGHRQRTSFVVDATTNVNGFHDAAAQQAHDTRGESVLRPLLQDNAIPEQFVIVSDAVIPGPATAGRIAEIPAMARELVGELLGQARHGR